MFDYQRYIRGCEELTPRELRSRLIILVNWKRKLKEDFEELGGDVLINPEHIGGMRLIEVYELVCSVETKLRALLVEASKTYVEPDRERLKLEIIKHVSKVGKTHLLDLVQMFESEYTRSTIKTIVTNLIDKGILFRSIDEDKKTRIVVSSYPIDNGIKERRKLTFEESSKSILNVIRDNGSITAKEVADALKLSTASVYVVLSRMVQVGLVEVTNTKQKPYRYSISNA